MKLIFCLTLWSLCSQTPDSLKYDLQYVKTTLEHTHPALYRYTPKAQFDHFFDSLDHAITHPMNEEQFLFMLSAIYEKLGDGHTMFLPSEKTMQDTSLLFFPLPLHEVDSINGLSVDSIRNYLVKYQVRDAHNKTYPLWIVDHFFGPYYSYAFGHPRQFDVVLKDGLHTQVNAIPRRKRIPVQDITCHQNIFKNKIL